MWVFAHGMINLVAMQVAGMARAVEAQAPYTHGHAERVTHYALQLSRRTMAPNGTQPSFASSTRLPPSRHTCHVELKLVLLPSCPSHVA